MAKLRVGWTVAGWAPGVRTIANRFRFHWTTGSIDWAVKAAAPVNWAVKAALDSAHAVTSLVTVIVLLLVVGRPSRTSLSEAARCTSSIQTNKNRQIFRAAGSPRRGIN